MIPKKMIDALRMAIERGNIIAADILDDSDLEAALTAALSELPTDPRLHKVEVDGPACPMCGFNIVKAERKPFHIEDDQP